MEKSIETIWKEGFLDHDALVAPKINNLYNQKSKTIIEKLKRMLKVNLYLVVALAVLNLVLYSSLGTPFAGLFIFLLLMGVCWITIKQGQEMKCIDSGLSSYDYLRSFDSWLKAAMSGNAKLMRFFYPLVFVAALMPMVHALKTGEKTNEAILNSGYHLTLGIPTFAWLTALAVAALIYVYGEKIYRWDVNMVYGRIFKKIETMIAEMEELRKE